MDRGESLHPACGVAGQAPGNVLELVLDVEVTVDELLELLVDDEVLVEVLELELEEEVDDELLVDDEVLVVRLVEVLEEELELELELEEEVDELVDDEELVDTEVLVDDEVLVDTEVLVVRLVEELEEELVLEVEEEVDELVEDELLVLDEVLVVRLVEVLELVLEEEVEELVLLDVLVDELLVLVDDVEVEVDEVLVEVVDDVVVVSGAAAGAKAARVWAMRFEVEAAVHPSVSAPAVALGFVLLAARLLEATTSQRSVCPAFAVYPVSGFPEPTQSKVQALLVRVVMPVEMVSTASMAFEAVASGACCAAPVTDIVPPVMSVEPVDVIET